MEFEFIEDEAVRAKAVEAHKASVASINEGIDTKIEEAVGQLKAKNEELIGEKRTIQETLKNFDNIDPKKAREALDFLDGNEEAQMIKDGKIEDVLAKRTSALISDHEATMTELMTKLSESETSGDLHKGLYQRKMIEDALRDAAFKAKVRPEALTDILLRGSSVFSLAEDGSVEARTADGKLTKTDDEKVLTTSLWIEGLKKVSPHYWPASEGIDANGESTSGSDIEVAMQRAASKGDHTEYRRLKKKKDKNK